MTVFTLVMVLFFHGKEATIIIPNDNMAECQVMEHDLSIAYGDAIISSYCVDYRPEYIK